MGHKILNLNKMLIVSDFSVQTKLSCNFASALNRYIYQTLAIIVLIV